MTSFKAGLMACAVKGWEDQFTSGSSLGSPRERMTNKKKKGIKRRPSTHLSHFSSSSSFIFNPLIFPASISHPKYFFKKTYTSPPLPVPSRLTVLLSDSDISPRLHRLTAHRFKSYISHTLPLAVFLFTPAPHQPQIIFNHSNVQRCLQHKPSMPPPIPPSLLPCQGNPLAPLLWHTRSHIPATLSHHRRPDPASTPRPCHL